MLIVNVQPTLPAPQAIEFGKDVDRSGKGAIHFRPGSTKTLTKGEWAYIQEHHRDLAAHVVVVKGDSAPKAPSVEPVAESTKANEVESEPEPQPEPEPSDMPTAAQPELEPESAPKKDTTKSGKRKAAGGVRKRKVKPTK